MKEFKGTPGPWWLDQFDNVVHGKPDNWGRKERVHVSGVALPGRVTEEYAANTRLVAAAPDLLAALQSLVKIYDSGSSIFYTTETKQRALDKAKVAIDKALGEAK